MACAYASHGDTKHALLIPEDPAETFDFAADAFDLADRLQTPVFVMIDLDIGMNHRLCRPLTWDDKRQYDRGKVLSQEDLDKAKDFGRYMDVDGDGIAYRTYPGTHPEKGVFFTRGTSHDSRARYTEQGSAYVEGMQRLLRKLDTRQGIPAEAAAQGCRQGHALRRDLLRLDIAGDERGRGDARRQRPSPQHAAHSRLPVPPGCRQLHRRP